MILTTKYTFREIKMSLNLQQCKKVATKVTIAKMQKRFCQKMLAQIDQPSKIASTSKIASHLQ